MPANVRLHLWFSAAVLPAELPAQRARTRGFVAIADWVLLVLWAYAGVALMEIVSKPDIRSADEAKAFGYFRQSDGVSFDRARQLHAHCATCSRS